MWKLSVEAAPEIRAQACFFLESPCVDDPFRAGWAALAQSGDEQYSLVHVKEAAKKEHNKRNSRKREFTFVSCPLLRHPSRFLLEAQTGSAT